MVFPKDRWIACPSEREPTASRGVFPGPGPSHPEVFWGPFAAAMLCGLLNGTPLRLLLGPIPCATLYRLRAKGEAGPAKETR